MSLQSAKTRYIKLQSSTDRASGELNRCTFDLTSTSFLQNVRAAQLLGAGFTKLSPNVRADENTVILQTNDIEFQVPALPDMRVRWLVDGGIGGLLLTFPSPPPGNYTPLQWAATAAASITTGIQTAIGSITWDLQITVDSYNPLVFRFDLSEIQTNADEIRFFPDDPIAPYLGITPDRYRVFGQQSSVYPGPLYTFPQSTFIGTLHEFTIPSANYDITSLISALNNVPAPDPVLVDPTWTFTNDRVHVSTALDYPQLRVISVIESRESSLAPLLGYHGYTGDQFFFTHVADTAPGLYGLGDAWLHIRPVSTGTTVTVSATDQQALEVSAWAKIPCHDVPFGEFVQYDFSKSGESYLIRFEDDRDLSRIQVRARDHQGRLLDLSHPGLTLWLKVFLR